MVMKDNEDDNDEEEDVDFWMTNKSHSVLN